MFIHSWQVDYEDQSSFLWYFNYPLEEGEGFLTVARLCHTRVLQ